MRHPPTISTQRIFFLMAAVFGLGLAIGLVLYPFIGSANLVSSILIFLSATLILFSLRWEHRP